ncbi:hypothetical protein [Pseudomonas sp. MWU12-2037]|uniref:hypothetical protein n=1 Tax=Pseudomonas sp. MWU12-2037 TaxID=2928690 RepID=UPI00200D3BF9|nr:hypothetical protein [Pseudomonas sp. MWU12-2037]
MKNLDDFTDFENGERNGWENEIGSPDGILKTEAGPEGPNTFWSGKLEWRPPNTFLPSLFKMFTLSGKEQEKEWLEISFKYRVYPPEPGEATTITGVITQHFSIAYNSFFIDEYTPTNEWLQGDPIKILVVYSNNLSHLLIGARNGTGPGVSRKIDIDDIKVVRTPVK